MSTATRMLAVFALAFTGCDTANKSKAETNGVSSIPEAKQFAAMSPGADHLITYFTGTKGDPLWNSKAGGDLSVLGVEIVTNHPLPHFAEVWQRG